MANYLQAAPRCRDLTDDQSFCEMVESFVAFRSDSEKRKFPRFPTPAALSGKSGLQGFEGALVVGEASSPGEATRDFDGGRRRHEADIEKIGVNIVDFSENGVQLQLVYNEFLHLQRSALYLQIKNHRTPVHLRWWKQCRHAARAGFVFGNRIDSDIFWAGFISNLNNHLIDFLMSTYVNGLATFKKQVGIFIYLSIFYGLRLKLLETIAKYGASFVFSNDKVSKVPVNILDHYLTAYHITQLNRSDYRIENIIYKFNMLFRDIGCGTIGMHEDIAFTKDEASSTILHSILLAKNGPDYLIPISPKLSFLHSNFLQLKRLLMPKIFDDDIFEMQFRYYSIVIQEIDRARKNASQTNFNCPRD